MAPVHFLPEGVRIQSEGRWFVPRVLARERTDAMWEAWIEFHAEDGAAVYATERESTQPNRAAVEYWVSGLEPVYYEGAFTRAAERQRRIELERDAERRIASSAVRDRASDR